MGPDWRGGEALDGRALSGVAGLSVFRGVERGGFVGVVVAGVVGAVPAGAVARGVSAGVTGPGVGRGVAVVPADVVVAGIPGAVGAEVEVPSLVELSGVCVVFGVFGVVAGAAVSGPRLRLEVDCSGGGAGGRFRLEVGWFWGTPTSGCGVPVGGVLPAEGVWLPAGWAGDESGVPVSEGCDAEDCGVLESGDWGIPLSGGCCDVLWVPDSVCCGFPDSEGAGASGVEGSPTGGVGPGPAVELSWDGAF